MILKSLQLPQTIKREKRVTCSSRIRIKVDLFSILFWVITSHSSRDRNYFFVYCILYKTVRSSIDIRTNLGFSIRSQIIRRLLVLLRSIIVNMERVRRASHAGSWYTDNRKSFSWLSSLLHPFWSRRKRKETLLFSPFFLFGGKKGFVEFQSHALRSSSLITLWCVLAKLFKRPQGFGEGIA